MSGARDARVVGVDFLFFVTDDVNFPITILVTTANDAVVPKIVAPVASVRVRAVRA
jgi:hypothetical protein